MRANSQSSSTIPSKKAAIARSYPSPPAPLPDPGRGEQYSQASQAISRRKQCSSQAGAIAIARKQASARARIPPSPAGGRGGRGVRVVTAQPKRTNHLCHPNPMRATKQSLGSMPSKKAAVARTFPSPPAPLPDPGRGEQDTQAPLAISRRKQCRSQSGAIAIAPKRASARDRFSPSPAGGRGGRGVRVETAQPQAHQALMPPQSHVSVQSIAQPHAPRKSSHCAVFPLTPRPSPRPGARGARHSVPACN